MNPESSSSASNTDTTSANGQKKPAGPGSEAEFLAHQAEEAKRAITAAFGALAKDLRDGADPRAWTKEHPWAVVAGAAVAGFAAAATLVPSKEEQALRRLAAMERALMPKASKADHARAMDDGESGGAKDFSRGRASFLTAVGRQLLEALKPALMSALTAGITAKSATPNAADVAPQPPPTDRSQPPQQAVPPSDPSADI
ncbi:MAG: hypothetical protein WBD40_21185 [Tepidisphaeraceae bacterium]